jgi:hypothetical protein
VSQRCEDDLTQIYGFILRPTTTCAKASIKNNAPSNVIDSHVTPPAALHREHR